MKIDTEIEYHETHQAEAAVRRSAHVDANQISVAHFPNVATARVG